MWKTRPTNVVAMRRLLSMNELGRCALVHLFRAKLRFLKRPCMNELGRCAPVQSETEVPEKAVHGPNTVALEGAPNFAHVALLVRGIGYPRQKFGGALTQRAKESEAQG